MANSYTATPSVVPGKLTVGGDLDVKGTVLVGPYTQRLRLFTPSDSEADVTENLQTDLATQDDLTKSSAGLKIGQLPGYIHTLYVPANGNLFTHRLGVNFDSDSTDHTHTGDTLVDVIYSTLVPKGVLGNNGQFGIKVCLVPTVQGAGTTQVFIRWGAVHYLAASIVAADVNQEIVIDAFIGNKGANNSQNLVFCVEINGQAIQAIANIAAVDTTNNVTVYVEVQNNNNADSQTLQFYEVYLIRD